MVNVCFLDTSALLKRYVSETGSARIRRLASSGENNRLFVSRIAWVEMLSALARLEREGNLSPEHVTSTVRIFQYDWETQYHVVEVDGNLVGIAGQLVREHPLRAYDAVQLASALRIHSATVREDSDVFTFVSADNRLLNAASDKGLRTDNPNVDSNH